MTPSQVVVLISLIAHSYSVPVQKMDCIVYRESSYRAEAVNGIHTGLGQYNPNTWDWFVFMALRDPAFHHAAVVRAKPDQNDPVVALLIMAWAIRNGYGPHWSTWAGCQ